MKYVIFAMLLLNSAIASAKSLEVTIHYSSTESDNQVRERARLEAKHLVSKDAAVLLYGKERIENGQYSEQLTAYSASAYLAAIKQEQWDRQRRIFFAKVEVVRDEDAAAQAFKDLRANAQLKAELANMRAAYAQLLSELASGSISQADLEQAQAQLAANSGSTVPPNDTKLTRFYDTSQYVMDTEADKIAAHSSYLRRHFFEPFLQSMRFEVVEIRADAVVVEFSNAFFDSLSIPCQHYLKRYSTGFWVFHQDQDITQAKACTPALFQGVKVDWLLKSHFFDPVRRFTFDQQFYPEGRMLDFALGNFAAIPAGRMIHNPDVPLDKANDYAQMHQFLTY
ncbi:hypothetical protein [Pseudoalteromonas rubra]|uniref:Uncharacterized protein n=1 Tax=Pseudoalteromonas rubra TaxID=43658 RepID=A0A0U3GML1_9GAMM|nr:hypothetical protein [Pseudoalteromonas rubra]ALU46138.1 hypothetical protein AT705_24560 [Pseudoalteromonas rubra]